MSILALVETVSSVDGSTLQLAKFVPECLSDLEGGAGFGGAPSKDPVESAKDWMSKTCACGDKLIVVDTQCGKWSEYFRTVFTMHFDNGKAKWVKCK